MLYWSFGWLVTDNQSLCQPNPQMIDNDLTHSLLVSVRSHPAQGTTQQVAYARRVDAQDTPQAALLIFWLEVWSVTGVDKASSGLSHALCQ